MPQDKETPDLILCGPNGDRTSRRFSIIANTCESPDPAPLEEPGARVSSVVLKVELLGDPVPLLPVEGVPSDTDADVSRHGAEHHLNLEEPRSLLI